MKSIIFLIAGILGCSSFATAQSVLPPARECECDQSCGSEESSGMNVANVFYRNPLSLWQPIPREDLAQYQSQPDLIDNFRVNQAIVETTSEIDFSIFLEAASSNTLRLGDSAVINQLWAHIPREDLAQYQSQLDLIDYFRVNQAIVETTSAIDLSIFLEAARSNTLRLGDSAVINQLWGHIPRDDLVQHQFQLNFTDDLKVNQGTLKSISAIDRYTLHVTGNTDALSPAWGHETRLPLNRTIDIDALFGNMLRRDVGGKLSQPERKIIIRPFITGGGSIGSDTYNVPKSRKTACRMAVRSSNSTANVSCAGAVLALCAYSNCGTENIKAAMSRKDINGLPTSTAKKTIDLFNDYASSCLVGDDKPVTQDVGNFDFNYIRARTGVLKPVISDGADLKCRTAIRGLSSEYNPDSLLCSAAVIDSKTIVTARHCFVTDSHKWKSISSCIDRGAVQFISIENPNAPISIKKIIDAGNVLSARKRTDQDYIKLELAEVIEGINWPTILKKPEQFDNVVIVAPHQLVTPKIDQNDSWPIWRRKVKLTSPGCFVTRVANGCAVTNCQTVAGYSGSPVWIATNDNHIALGGIQTKGGTGSFGTCGTNNTLVAGGEGNLAIWGFIDGE
ncbi:hypothetical protein [Thalassospira xiamenensis]|uniref:hypothetical protein n=1 Tax=Thalassospira xiamenensis TaxID=220697 RepID=UPI0011BEF429|nr:hypothetical protein [Thalassospira xiamenensis]